MSFTVVSNTHLMPVTESILQKQTQSETDGTLLEDRACPGVVLLNFRPVYPTVSCQSKHTLLKYVQLLHSVWKEHEIL